MAMFHELGSRVYQFVRCRVLVQVLPSGGARVKILRTALGAWNRRILLKLSAISVFSKCAIFFTMTEPKASYLTDPRMEKFTGSGEVTLSLSSGAALDVEIAYSFLG